MGQATDGLDESAPMQAAQATVRRLLRSGAVQRPRVEGQPHLDAAAAALMLAEAAHRLARAEVMAARDADGATWEQVGIALDMSRQSAHERFRTGPDGMHTRLFKKRRGAQNSEGSSGPTTSATTERSVRRRVASS